jgi:hypothetical protein
LLLRAPRLTASLFPPLFQKQAADSKQAAKEEATKAPTEVNAWKDDIYLDDDDEDWAGDEGSGSAPRRGGGGSRRTDESSGSGSGPIGGKSPIDNDDEDDDDYDVDPGSGAGAGTGRK